MKTTLLGIIIASALVTGCKSSLKYCNYKGKPEEYILYRNKFRYTTVVGLGKPIQLEGNYRLAQDSIFFYFKYWQDKLCYLTPRIVEKTIKLPKNTIEFYFIKQNGDTLKSANQFFILNNIYQSISANRLGIYETEITVKKIQVIGTMIYHSVYTSDSNSNYIKIYIYELPDSDEYLVPNTIDTMSYTKDSIFDGLRYYYLTK
jgi:hypothetical protein